MDFFTSDTDEERVDALIDLLLEALAEAPLEYSESDCVAAVVGVLRELLEDEPPIVH